MRFVLRIKGIYRNLVIYNIFTKPVLGVNFVKPHEKLLLIFYGYLDIFLAPKVNCIQCFINKLLTSY